MTDISQTTLNLLENAGWNESYRAATTQYQEFLASEGYSIPSAVIDFLSTFGGLQITHPHPRIPEQMSIFHFDPIEAGSHIFSEKVQKYSQRLGISLCVIGESNSGYMVLMMDESGKVFAAYDDLMLYIADSGREAIEALSNGQYIAELPKPS